MSTSTVFTTEKTLIIGILAGEATALLTAVVRRNVFVNEDGAVAEIALLEERVELEDFLFSKLLRGNWFVESLLLLLLLLRLSLLLLLLL